MVDVNSRARLRNAAEPFFEMTEDVRWLAIAGKYQHYELRRLVINISHGGSAGYLGVWDSNALEEQRR